MHENACELNAKHKKRGAENESPHPVHLFEPGKRITSLPERLPSWAIGLCLLLSRGLLVEPSCRPWPSCQRLLVGLRPFCRCLLLGLRPSCRSLLVGRRPSSRPSSRPCLLAAFFSAFAGFCRDLPLRCAWAATIPDVQNRKTNAIAHTMKRFILLPPLFSCFVSSLPIRRQSAIGGNLPNITLIHKWQG